MSLGSSPHLASIHIYPLKSGRAVDLPGSRVEPCGLAGDRRWLVVDGTGRFITQRAEPALALVTAGHVPPGQAAGEGHPGRSRRGRSPCPLRVTRC